MVDSIRKTRTGKFKGGVLCLLSFLLFVHFSNGQEISWSVEKDIRNTNYGQVFLEGISADHLELLKSSNLDFNEWSSFFEIKVDGSKRAMLGTYQIDSGRIVFTPRFLPDPQIEYVVYFSSENLKKLVPAFSGDTKFKSSFSFKQYEQGKTGLVTFLPEIDTLPSNILRIYLQFSIPMSFENPHRFVTIQDKSGKIMKNPFVEIEEGLWNSKRTRLTLLFHPGRIKRGVGPNTTQGEIFEENNSYKLVVSENWKTSSGNTLGQKFIRHFFMTSEVRNTIDIASWEIVTPKSLTKETLIVYVKEPLDNALAERLISVVDENGNQIVGTVHLNSKTRQLHFFPVKKWNDGSYSILIDRRLEDVCGNTMYNVFDLEGKGMVKGQKSEELFFTIK